MAIDLTKTELEALKGEPSERGLCSYFPEGEYFLQKRETMAYSSLPVDIANIEPGSPMATKKAHYNRLKTDLPKASSFGKEYTKYSLQGKASHEIVTHSDRTHAKQEEQAESKALQALEHQPVKSTKHISRKTVKVEH